MTIKQLFLTLPLAGLIAAGSVFADQAPPTYAPAPNYGPGSMGPGMGGYGPGPGYPPEYGYGPGAGMGYGAAQGYGPRGGYGPQGDFDPGTMEGRSGFQALWSLDLSAKQREAIGKILADLQRHRYEQMGRVYEAMSKLQRLYAQETWDAKAIGQAFGKMFDAQRDGIVAMVQARNEAYQQLTEQQRQQLRSGTPWGPAPR